MAQGQAPLSVTIHGGTQLRRALKETAGDTDDLKELNKKIAEIVVDGMDINDLINYVHCNMMDHFVSLTADELEEEVYNHDEELWEELVDNVTNTDPILYNNGGKS